MKLTSKAKDILESINDKTRLGDLRKIAKETKIDHDLSLELWSTGEFLPRLLSILILDYKLVTKEVIDRLDKDMQAHPFDERNQTLFQIKKWPRHTARAICTEDGTRTHTGLLPHAPETCVSTNSTTSACGCKYTAKDQKSISCALIYFSRKISFLPSQRYRPHPHHLIPQTSSLKPDTS